jgi:hypothetical protein
MKLNEIVAVSGLLLTLTTFLFNLAWPKIRDALNQDEATSGNIARRRCRKKINNTLWFTVFPIFLAFFALFYVNLPTAIKILFNSKIELWDFDVDDTLYVMVVYALLAFVTLNAYLCIRLTVKQGKFK